MGAITFATLKPMGETKHLEPGDALAQLSWQVEMGADESISDIPVDRFAATAARLAQRQPAAEVAVPEKIRTPLVQPAQPPIARPPVPNDEAERDARKIAASCETLAFINQALETFDACPLQRTASNLCYFDGNPDARIMFIGEAPGRDEDIQGKPFVGRSGQLLDKMLKAIGLDRNSDDPATAAFITNVIYWRPPGNRKPTEAETLMCLPFVERTIELQAPEVIVCLGATPMQRLTGRTDGILKSRGRWREVEIAGRKIPLMATLHPAYLLRQPAQKRLAWRDFLQVGKRLSGNA